MPEKEVDRREEIFTNHCDIRYDSVGDSESVLTKLDAFFAMDEYFTERAYELLDYMASKGIMCCMDSDGPYFKVRGEVLTKEQLFENFL